MVKLLFLLVSLALATGYLSAQSLAHGNFVVIVDQDLPNIEDLIKGIRPGARIAYLDKSLHPLVYMNKVIRENAPISSLHILSYGKPGSLIFSYQELNTKYDRTTSRTFWILERILHSSWRYTSIRWRGWKR